MTRNAIQNAPNIDDNIFNQLMADIPLDQSAQTLTLRLPAVRPDVIDTILKLQLDEPWTTSALVSVPAE